MNTEERNKWILTNIDEIENVLRSYCDRHPVLDYEELYSETMIYLIDYLDRNGEPKNRLSCFLGNYIHKILKAKNQYETPVDFFEIIFLQDFDFESSAIVKALIERANFDNESYYINIVKDIAVDGYTFKQASEKYGLRNVKQTRADYLYALTKLRMAAIRIRYNLYS